MKYLIYFGWLIGIIVLAIGVVLISEGDGIKGMMAVAVGIFILCTEYKT
jgi:hypothetical protein